MTAKDVQGRFRIVYNGHQYRIETLCRRWLIFGPYVWRGGWAKFDSYRFAFHVLTCIQAAHSEWREVASDHDCPQGRPPQAGTGVVGSPV